MNLREIDSSSGSNNIEQESVLMVLRQIVTEVHYDRLALIGCILFGSRARGDFRKDSDTDVILIINRMWSTDGLHELFNTEMSKTGLVPDNHNFKPEGIGIDEIHRARDDSDFRDHFIKMNLEGLGSSAVPISIYPEIEELLEKWLKNVTDWKITRREKGELK